MGFRVLSPSTWQPLDRVALSIVVGLCLPLAVLLWSGDRTRPMVREFSWHHQTVTASDTAFVLTFNRPMNPQSVEANLAIAPPLPGRISWAGRRLVYTLNAPARYGQTYRISLRHAYDRFANEAGNHKPIAPFEASFSTPAPAFAYIATLGERAGRLILRDARSGAETVLTPADRVVTDFRIYPDRRKIAYLAAPRAGDGADILAQELFAVTTGLNGTTGGNVERLLDARDFQNFAFDLAPDGKLLVVQRLDRRNPGAFGLWVLRDGQAPAPLNNSPGGDFAIAPDSASIAIAQGEGIAMLPLESHANPLDFLPKFGKLLSFSADGTQAAVVEFRKDYVRSLFRVSNQGEQAKLLDTKGSVLAARFAPSRQTLYALLTDLEESQDVYREHPYVAAIDLNTATLTRLLELRDRRDIHIDLAPDGTYLLYDATVAVPSRYAERAARSPDAVALPPVSEIGLLPLVPDAPPLAAASFPGRLPRWLP